MGKRAFRTRLREVTLYKIGGWKLKTPISTQLTCANRHHHCDGCKVEIEPGDFYLSAEGLTDSELGYTGGGYMWCLDCIKYD